MAVETVRAPSLHFCVCGNARCRDGVHTVSTNRPSLQYILSVQ